MRLRPGQIAPAFEVTDVFGIPHQLSVLKGRKVLLSFYRYSACPFCNLRIRDMITAWPELAAEGLTTLSFWQSAQDDILAEVGAQKPPFPMIADPTKQIYRRYGVENRPLAPWLILLKPGQMRRALRSPYMTLKSRGERDLVPADFLINPDQTIAEAYYGGDVGDHIPIARIRAWLAR